MLTSSNEPRKICLSTLWNFCLRAYSRFAVKSQTSRFFMVAWINRFFLLVTYMLTIYPHSGICWLLIKKNPTTLSFDKNVVAEFPFFICFYKLVWKGGEDELQGRAIHQVPFWKFGEPNTACLHILPYATDQHNFPGISTVHSNSQSLFFFAHYDTKDRSRHAIRCPTEMSRSMGRTFLCTKICCCLWHHCSNRWRARICSCS